MAIAPLLTVWSDLAPRVARLTQGHPNFAARLIVAPTRAIHCYAIYMQLSGIDDDELLARTLFEHHPRELLDEAWPDRHPQLRTMLDRISGPTWEIERYQRLDRLLKSRVSEPVMNTTRINECTIIFHEELEKLDILVTSAANALQGNLSMAKALHAAIVVMRKMHVLSNDEVEAASLKNARKDGLGRWLERRLRKATAPTVPLPPSLYQITDCTEMVSLGRQMKNCLGDTRTLLTMLMGDFVFLRMHDEAGPIVVSMARGPGECWMINEAQAIHHHHPAKSRMNVTATAVSVSALISLPWR